MYESQIMESIYQEKKQYIPLFMIRPPPAYFTLIDPITFLKGSVCRIKGETV